MSEKMKLPKGWRWMKLGEVCDEIRGGGTPSRKRKDFYIGNIPWATPSDLTKLQDIFINSTKDFINEEAIRKSSTILLPIGTVMLTSRASIGMTAINTVPMCTNQGFANFLCGPDLSNLYLAYYLPFIKNQLTNFAGGSTFKEITKTTLKDIEIPLPPLPVQERIVEILQQADAIRRKRAEARKLADQILPALFLEMFGDPANGKRGNVSFLDFAEVSPRTEIPVRDDDVENSLYSLIQIADIDESIGKLRSHSLKPLSVLRKGYSRFKEGDVLFARITPCTENGKIALVTDLPNKIGFGSTEFWVIRPKSEIFSVFLLTYLRFPKIRNLASRSMTGTSGRQRVPKTFFETLSIPKADSSTLKQFNEVAIGLNEQSAGQNEAIVHSGKLYHYILSRAFTGELTTEWELENADWIATRQAFYERLPKLALLALLAEKAHTTATKVEVLVTALMKYAFLLQMEGAAQRRLYHFAPYHYGPFAKDLYADLHALQQDGLLSVTEDADEVKTRITLTDPKKATSLLTELPEDQREILAALRQDAAAIIESYGELSHKALLETVYEKYPAYAKKSRVRQRR